MATTTLQMKIGKRFQLPSSSDSSFKDDLRELLWARGTKALWIGLGVTVLMVLAYQLFIGEKPIVVTAVAKWKPWLRLGHPLSFAVALGLLYILRQKACAMKIQAIAFFVFASNIAVSTVSQLACRPDIPDFFSLSLLLFIPAAFIPWKAFHQLLLGAVAIVAFVGAQIYGMTRSSEFAAFWYSRPEDVGFVAFVGMSTLAMAVLSLVSFTISRTLYTLNRTTHHVAALGNYLIEEEIGEGGMGKVLLARHRLMCRPTAVKVMQATEGDAASALARFEREVQLSANLTHPNTIQIFDFGRTGEDVFYYAMEYLSGLDLQRVVERFGPLTPERTVFILMQAAASLAEAHSKNIVHRDIKPSNIFLTERGGLHDFVKVLDFGLAKRVTGDGVSAVTRTGMVFGTPRYISPEALYGKEEVDGRADLYNLGGVAYWLLTGKPPFSTSSSVDLIIDHVKTVPPRPSEISEMPIPRALEDVVMRCLEKKAEDRYQTAEELRDALKDVADEIGASWGWDQAREWWELHGLQENVPVCS